MEKLPEIAKRGKRVYLWRRLVQIAVLGMLVMIPFYSQNPNSWSPSRIIQGQLPPPATFALSGDTWSFAIGDFRLTHPVAFLESWVSAKVVYLPLLIATLLPLAMTLVLGRFFCSWLCPVGFILELNMKSNTFFEKLGLHREIRIPDFRYLILALSLVFGFFLAFPVISVFDPPHLLGRELMYFFTHQEVSLMGVGFLFAIVLFEMFFTSRGWCNVFCPSGGGLALLGMKRLWRIRMTPENCIHCGECDKTCPYRLGPMGLAEGDRFDWTKCDNCGRCRDGCPAKAISYTFSMKNNKSLKQKKRGE